MIASSDASTVASKTDPIFSFESSDTLAVLLAPAAPAFAVEKAMKMSPDPLLEMLPVRARPSEARRASRLS